MGENINALEMLIKERIGHYESELINALDKKDSLGAFQARAVQRELESILDSINLIAQVDVEKNALPKDLFITTREVSQLLGICPTTVTRNAINLKGKKTKKGWIFPKKYVESQVEAYKLRNKPGRKPRTN